MPERRPGRSPADRQEHNASGQPRRRSDPKVPVPLQSAQSEYAAGSTEVRVPRPMEVSGLTLVAREAGPRRMAYVARPPSQLSTLSGHTRVRCFATAVWHLIRGRGGPLYVEVEVALGVSIEIKVPLSMRPAWPRPGS